MYAVTSGFLSQLREPSMRVAVTVTASTGATLGAVSGQVEMDSRRGITRTCSLELTATDDLSIADVYALVMTPGVELTVKRGLLVKGVVEYVPLGVFSTDTAKKPARGTGTVSWSGSDRAKKISRSKFTDAYQIAAGTSLATAAGALLTSRWAQVQYDFTNVAETVATQVVFEAGSSADPWDQARKLFADYGYDLHFDGDGFARATVIPDPATQPAVFDFGSGDTQLVLDGETNGTFEQTYNGVIVTGEGSGVTSAVRGEAWDDDPNSPTYYLSGFGLVPYFYSSPLLTTAAQCTVAAQTMLAKVKGRVEQFSWPAVSNPALEPLDIVTVNLGTRLSRLVLDKVTVPITAAEPMTCIARETSTA